MPLQRGPDFSSQHPHHDSRLPELQFQGIFHPQSHAHICTYPDPQMYVIKYLFTSKLMINYQNINEVLHVFLMFEHLLKIVKIRITGSIKLHLSMLVPLLWRTRELLLIAHELPPICNLSLFSDAGESKYYFTLTQHDVNHKGRCQHSAPKNDSVIVKHNKTFWQGFLWRLETLIFYMYVC